MNTGNTCSRDARGRRRSGAPLHAALASAVLFVAGCSNGQESTHTTTTSTGTTTTSTSTATSTKLELSGDLAVDIRETAHVALAVDGSALTATVTLSKGFGVAPTTAFVGAGHVEPLPEADVALYTARFDAPADPTGPCGAKEVSLALSLHRRAKDAHVGGSLTAYCGKGVWHGVPARLLRLAGDLPLP